MSDEALYTRDGDAFVSSLNTRGPWDKRAQHGGAPAALMAYLAEAEEQEPGFRLTRITMELLRPVPVERLSATVESSGGRSVHRRTITLAAGGKAVARALAISVRAGESPLPETAPDPRRMPARGQGESLHITGMDSGGPSFGYTAMETEVVAGSVTQPGPASVWFRLRVPVVAGEENSPAMRAMAAADFGNGVSWMLPFGRYTFLNYDLTVYLHSPPAGEWVGVDARTLAPRDGLGLSETTLFDDRGTIGVAQQGLIIREAGV